MRAGGPSDQIGTTSRAAYLRSALGGAAALATVVVRPKETPAFGERVLDTWLSHGVCSRGADLMPSLLSKAAAAAAHATTAAAAAAVSVTRALCRV